MRALLLASALVVLCAGCGGRSAHSEVALRITVTRYVARRGGEPRKVTARYTLGCRPTTGTLPLAARVCDDIARHRQAMLAPRRRRSTCAGGPFMPFVQVSVRLGGTANGFSGSPGCGWPGGTPLTVYFTASIRDARDLSRAEPLLRCDDDPALFVEPTPNASVAACTHGLWTAEAERAIRAAESSPEIAPLEPRSLFPNDPGARRCTIRAGGPAPGRRIQGLCEVRLTGRASAKTVHFVESWPVGSRVVRRRWIVGPAGAPWTETLRAREPVPANAVVEGRFLVSLVSRTVSPERGPYRLTRRDLWSGSVRSGPLFDLPQIAAASGRLWLGGTMRGDAVALEVDPGTLRPVRTFALGRAYPALPRVVVASGPEGSVWLGSDARLVRTTLRGGRVVARVAVPPGYVVADAATDPSRRHLYVSLTRKVSGGATGAVIVEYDATSGRELARNAKDVSYSVAGAGLTAVPAGVWASFRTGLLGVTIHLRRSGLGLVPPPPPHSTAARLFDWPMDASTLYGPPSLWVANEAGFLACVDPSTGRVRASDRVDRSRSLQLLDVDSADGRIVAIDGGVRVVAITPPAVCF